MIYWSQRQLPELAHLSSPERRAVWVSFVSARALAPRWHSRVLGGVIILAMAAGFSVGLFALPTPTFVATLACSIAGILVGFLPVLFLHLSFINSESVRRDLKKFVSHPASISDPLLAALACREMFRSEPQ